MRQMVQQITQQIVYQRHQQLIDIIRQVITESTIESSYHMWILVRICDANVCQFNVEELVDRMQRATYANQMETITLLSAHTL